MWSISEKQKFSNQRVSKLAFWLVKNLTEATFKSSSPFHQPERDVYFPQLLISLKLAEGVPKMISHKTIKRMKGNKLIWFIVFSFTSHETKTYGHQTGF